MRRLSSAEFARALAARLEAVRRELKLQHRDMANRIGITERVYRRYEAAEQVPGSDKLMALLKTLKQVSPEWLLMGTGKMRKPLDDRREWQAVLDIVESRPAIPRILELLPGLADEDLEVIEHLIDERRKTRQLHTELRSMLNQLQPSRLSADHEGDVGSPGAD